MPTARGYVRVSTEEQAVNGVSIDAQKEILQAYAVVKGYTDFKIYTDEGFSGSTMVVNATGQRRNKKTKLYYSCIISVMDVISKKITYTMPILIK